MTENLFTDRFAIFDENYKKITERIALAADKAGKQIDEITLLAATKTVPVEMINHAIDSGIKHIGENRVQEMMDKYDDFHKDECDIQFIGQLQSNKVKYIVGKVSQIQSVDSIKLAKEISRISKRENVTTKILVEVNIGKEESKGGVMPEALFEFIDEARSLENISINGLMAIPPICEDESELRRYFLAMREYYVDIMGKKLDNISMNVLSMGMSDDFDIAIECGANMVRIGSSLFGRRA